MKTPIPTIRSYREGDLDAFLAIFNTVVERGDAFVYDAPFSVDEARRYIASYAATYVAELGGRVVGGYLLRPNQSGRGSHVANATYMVSPEVRGHGLGRLLGEHSLKTAKAMGFSAMQFNAVVSANTGAVALWRSLGFDIVGTIPKAFRHADNRLVDLLVMYRPL